MKRRQNQIDETTELLDIDEQTKVINELKQAAQKQSTTTRFTFQILYLSISILFVMVLAYSFLYPMEMSHQKVFYNIVPSYVFQVYYSLSISLFFKLSELIRGKHFNSFDKAMVVIISSASLIYWGIVFYNFHVDNILLFWLPLSNLLGSLLAFYIDNDVKTIIADANKIEEMKYNYRAI